MNVHCPKVLVDMFSINLNRLNCYPIDIVEGVRNIDYSKVLVVMFSIHLK